MEEAKNMALLFFMDHLMQKNGRRTIHDLSCQFGARGFTQEMRDSVGATQEGLTDFLSQHSSLFIIDEDQVILRGYGEMDGKNQLAKIPTTPGHRQRDYVGEAVQFFVAKLEKFGPELQIKSLLGHRSQAAPEVRLVSGRHLKEFHDFLQAQHDYFVVEGDRVRLKHMPEPLVDGETPAEWLDEEGRPLAGVRAKQAALDFLRGVLEQEQADANNFSTEGGGSEDASTPIADGANNDNSKEMGTNSSSPPATPTVMPAPIPLDAFYRRFCAKFPHSVRQDVATNPKELLQFLKLNRDVFFIRSNKVSLVKNRLGGQSGGGGGAGADDQSDESGRSTANSSVVDNNGAESGGATLFGCGSGSAMANGGSITEWFPLTRDHLHRVQLVKTLKQAQEAVNSLITDLNDSGRQQQQNGGDKQQQQSTTKMRWDSDRFVCIDFKLVLLGGGGGTPLNGVEEFLSLIVVASRNRVAVFDLAHSDSILLESGLKSLLESVDVLKVIHDMKRAATLLAQRYAVNMRNVFDTQIAHSIIQHDKLGKPLSDLRAISFVNLQRVYFPQSLMLSDVTPRKLSQTTNWSQRPFSDALLLNAAEECHCLTAGLFRNVRQQLPDAHNRLFDDKCFEALTPAANRPPPSLLFGNAPLNVGRKLTASAPPPGAPGGGGPPLLLSLFTAALSTPPSLPRQTPSTPSSPSAQADGFGGIYRTPARRRLLNAAASAAAADCGGMLPPSGGFMNNNGTDFSVMNANGFSTRRKGSQQSGAVMPPSMNGGGGRNGLFAAPVGCHRCKCQCLTSQPLPTTTTITHYCMTTQPPIIQKQSPAQLIQQQQQQQQSITVSSTTTSVSTTASGVEESTTKKAQSSSPPVESAEPALTVVKKAAVTDAETQTISTGEITALKIFYD